MVRTNNPMSTGSPAKKSKNEEEATEHVKSEEPSTEIKQSPAPSPKRKRSFRVRASDPGLARSAKRDRFEDDDGEELEGAEIVIGGHTLRSRNSKPEPTPAKRGGNRARSTSASLARSSSELANGLMPQEPLDPALAKHKLPGLIYEPDPRYPLNGLKVEHEAEIEVAFNWEASRVNKRNERSVDSEMFSMGGRRWRLCVSPRGPGMLGRKNDVFAIYLHLLEPNKRERQRYSGYSLQFTLLLIDSTRDVIWNRTAHSCFLDHPEIKDGCCNGFTYTDKEFKSELSHVTGNVRAKVYARLFKRVDSKDTSRIWGSGWPKFWTNVPRDYYD